MRLDLLARSFTPVVFVVVWLDEILNFPWSSCLSSYSYLTFCAMLSYPIPSNWVICLRVVLKVLLWTLCENRCCRRSDVLHPLPMSFVSSHQMKLCPSKPQTQLKKMFLPNVCHYLKSLRTLQLDQICFLLLYPVIHCCSSQKFQLLCELSYCSGISGTEYSQSFVIQHLKNFEQRQHSVHLLLPNVRFRSRAFQV